MNVLLAFLIYLPSFVVPFTYWEDGELITDSKSGSIWESSSDSVMPLLHGRPLNALLFGLQIRITNHLWHLSLTRLLSFLLLAAAAYLLCSFLERRCGVKPLWACMMGMVFLLFPAHIVHINMAACLSVGSINILLSFCAYLLFDRCFDLISKKNMNAGAWSFVGLLFSALLFLATLCIYQVTSMFVFVFSFARVLFCFRADETKVRGIVIRDIVFFGTLMGLYYFLVKTVLVPWGLHFNPDLRPPAEYSLSVDNNFFLKGINFWNFLCYSFRGIWDIWGSVVGSLVVLFFLSAAVFFGRDALFSKIAKWRGSSHERALFFERLVWILVLLFLSCAPCLLGSGNPGVLGYRVLGPMSTMVMILIYKIYMVFDQRQGGVERARAFSNGRWCAIFFTIATVILSAWTLWNFVGKRHQEYIYARDQLRAVDFSKTKQLIFILNEGKKEEGLPMELGRLAYLRNAVPKIKNSAAYVKEFNGVDLVFMPKITIVSPAESIYYDQNTKVIDLVWGHLHPQNLEEIFVRTRSFAGDQVVVGSISGNKKRSIVYFHQKEGKRLRPFWSIGPNEKFGVLQFDWLSSVRLISEYSYSMELKDEGHSLKGVELKFQGSEDGRVWVDLDARRILPIESAMYASYDVPQKTAFRHYRFLLAKENQENTLKVSAIRFLFQ